MELGERERFLEGVATGSTALRDVGMLSPHDLDAIARVGAAALTGGRFEQAEQVFSALAALDPGAVVHWLHVAVARQGKGDVKGAVDACARVVDAGVDDEDTARALLLRAELLGRTDRAGAGRDLATARAMTSPGAKKVVDAALGAVKQGAR